MAARPTRNCNLKKAVLRRQSWCLTDIVGTHRCQSCMSQIQRIKLSLSIHSIEMDSESLWMYRAPMQLTVARLHPSYFSPPATSSSAVFNPEETGDASGNYSSRKPGNHAARVTIVLQHAHKAGKHISSLKRRELHYLFRCEVNHPFRAKFKSLWNMQICKLSLWKSCFFHASDMRDKRGVPESLMELQAYSELSFEPN
ncbi:hypothetical protein K503DRAFT_785314 [Rhizopogon vinicolor AM-OR11-026]|uniref:Uncharacterized protein n=1 Tax=Rhizopogon vinicolor AM-OR11-026 TaxID=1314800 RepID=A0A1B7MR71_9AGAM|nr:hypothetical protein K503DRAFT_785314 [Rhizopogon vinicolor AM-OR11-026]